jgi:hypothetical protein
MEKKITGHDEEIQMIFAAIKELLEPPQKKRKRIGFNWAAKNDLPPACRKTGQRQVQFPTLPLPAGRRRALFFFKILQCQGHGFAICFGCYIPMSHRDTIKMGGI